MKATGPRVRLSGWGRYPVAECERFAPPDAPALLALAETLSGMIVRGNGRSYGDASLNPEATVDMRRLDRLIEFDPASGSITCQAGLLLSDLIDLMLPRGWFPAVTPGTRFVAIGGLIANDVHGKNHHRGGSFCDHLDWLELASPEGGVLRCSGTGNPELFAATCGGMGLTGAILRQLGARLSGMRSPNRSNALRPLLS